MQFGILGGGSWATALAKLLTENGRSIHWCLRTPKAVEYMYRKRHNLHYLSSVLFNPAQLQLTVEPMQLLANADVVVLCIPSSYLLNTLSQLPQDAFAGKKIVSAVKGVLPNEKHQLLHEYLNEVFAFSYDDYFTIMGPCHAEEVAAEKLSYLTFSGEDEQMAAYIAGHFATDYLYPVVNHDIWGTQYAAVMKNIYAVGAGIAHGLEYGDNFLSVYITNAADEMVGFLKRVMEVKGAPDSGRINYASSVYLGDLLVTCYSLYSRNRSFGNMIGKGYSVKVAQLEMNMVAEGYPASKGIFEINQQLGAQLPIATAIYEILWEQRSPAEAFAHIEKWLR